MEKGSQPALREGKSGGRRTGYERTDKLGKGKTDQNYKSCAHGD